MRNPPLFLTEDQVVKIAEGVRARFGSIFSPTGINALKAAREGRLYRVRGTALGGLMVGDSPQAVLRTALMDHLRDQGASSVSGSPDLMDWMTGDMGWVAEQVVLVGSLAIRPQPRARCRTN